MSVFISSLRRDWNLQQMIQRIALELPILTVSGGDSVSSVAAVYDRRRCLNCCTVGAHRAPLQLGNPAIFKLSHYPVFPYLVQGIRHSAGMAVTVSVLGSGSRGNATFVRTDGVRLLIDAGMSRKEIAKRLEAIGEDPDGIDAVLVTHEHNDHAGGLKTLFKDLPIRVFMTWGTIRAL